MAESTSQPVTLSTPPSGAGIPPLTTPQRVVAAMAHLFAVIPIWGLVADFWIWHTRREEHPELRFQVLQALFVQAGLLLLAVLYELAQLYFQLLGVLNGDLAEALSGLSTWIFKVTLVALVLLVLWAVWRLRWHGHFEYPLLGPAMRRELERADAAERQQTSEE
jgi:uncharacterized Tic20 family protein